MECERNALQQEIPLLRSCLCDLSALTESIMPVLPEDSAGRIRRCIYRLRRLIDNMTDEPLCQIEYINLCAFVYEMLEKAGVLLQQAGITLEFSVPDTPVWGTVDCQLLERGIYNLLAFYCSPKDSKINAQLAICGEILRFSVVGRKLTQQSCIKWAQMAASRHSGTVLTDKLSDGSLRTTLTLTLSRHHSGSCPIRFDYAGGFDHCLLELSDILPPQVYSDNYFCSR